MVSLQNTTNFVVSKNALEVLEVDHAPRRIDEIALFTDGIENLVLHRGTKTVHDPLRCSNRYAARQTLGMTRACRKSWGLIWVLRPFPNGRMMTGPC
jgi:hypothetical protein